MRLRDARWLGQRKRAPWFKNHQCLGDPIIISAAGVAGIRIQAAPPFCFYIHSRTGAKSIHFRRSRDPSSGGFLRSTPPGDSGALRSYRGPYKCFTERLICTTITMYSIGNKTGFTKASFFFLSKEIPEWYVARHIIFLVFFFLVFLARLFLRYNISDR